MVTLLSQTIYFYKFRGRGRRRALTILGARYHPSAIAFLPVMPFDIE